MAGRGRPRGSRNTKKIIGPTRAVYKKNVARRGKVSRMVKLIKAVALGQSETKRLITYAENIQLNHNSPYVMYNLIGTSQGTSQIQRIGDEVIAQYLNVKLWLSQKLDRPNVMFRIIIFQPRAGTSNLDWATGTSPNRIVSTVDTDKLNFKKQYILKPPPGDYSLETGATNKERSRFLSFSINVKNMKIGYFNDNDTVPKLQKHNYCIVVIAYDSFGTLTTDNIASFSYQYEFYYKDC